VILARSGSWGSLSIKYMGVKFSNPGFPRVLQEDGGKKYHKNSLKWDKNAKRHYKSV
jgi:hypothetical protein